MDINNQLNELFDLLDQNEDLKEITLLKEKITDKEINLINNYRDNPTVENKKMLYENNLINQYLTCESKINYLIMEINKKFKRIKCCENNKW